MIYVCDHKVCLLYEPFVPFYNGVSVWDVF